MKIAGRLQVLGDVVDRLLAHVQVFGTFPGVPVLVVTAGTLYVKSTTIYNFVGSQVIVKFIRLVFVNEAPAILQNVAVTPLPVCLIYWNTLFPLGSGRDWLSILTTKTGPDWIKLFPSEIGQCKITVVFVHVDVVDLSITTASVWLVHHRFGHNGGF